MSLYYVPFTFNRKILLAEKLGKRHENFQIDDSVGRELKFLAQSFVTKRKENVHIVYTF